MATESAAAAMETNHRNGMVKRLSVISMSFLERLLKTAGPHDHDQWPPEPTIGPINPGMLTKISKQASEEYLAIMTQSGRDALAEFDGRLLRQVLRTVVFNSLSVSRKTRRATSPGNTHTTQSPSNNNDNAEDSQYTSPGITPRDYNSHHQAPHGVNTLPLSPSGNNINNNANNRQQLLGGSSSASPFFSPANLYSARSGTSAGSSVSMYGSSRFMALHPAKAEAMIAAKRMLDPLLTTSKFPREAYKAVVMDVGDQFMDRFHASEQFHHVNRQAGDDDNNNAEGDQQQQNLLGKHALTAPERDWITATVLSSISKIVVNEDGSILVNGRVVAYAPAAAGLSGLTSRGASQSPHDKNNNNNNKAGPDSSFLKQLQRLRTILQQEENGEQLPSVSVDSNKGLYSSSSPSSSVLSNQKPTPPQTQKPHRERVYCILAKYAPNRIDKVNKYMEQYAGVEDMLINALVEKYGPEPEGDAAVEIDVPVVAPPRIVNNNSNNDQDEHSQSRGTSSAESPARKQDLERQIANIQYQMQQMQSQLAACQSELKHSGGGDDASEVKEEGAVTAAKQE